MGNLIGHGAALNAGDTAPPTRLEIAARLRRLADEMDAIAGAMDYYGGFAEWARHGREIAGAGAIARGWAVEIEVDHGIGLHGEFAV